jgi:hypothetical protein
MTAIRATHRLRSGQLAVEIAPDFFKIAGEPVRTGLEVITRHGGVEPIDHATDSIEVSEDDLRRKDWLKDGQDRILQHVNEKARKYLKEKYGKSQDE